MDLGTVEATVSAPKRPQDKILVRDFKPKFEELLHSVHGRKYIPIDRREVGRMVAEGGGQSSKDAKDSPQDIAIKTQVKNYIYEESKNEDKKAWLINVKHPNLQTRFDLTGVAPYIQPSSFFLTFNALTYLTLLL